MDAGGLAQMSYNNFPVSNGLGLPGSGFAARRANGNNVKRLSFEPRQANEPINNGVPTPRTSRSHLLAGLRTAPKTATALHNNVPSTAPATQQHFNTGLGLSASMYAQEEPANAHHGSGYAQQNPYTQQLYPVAEQILAPPELRIDNNHQEPMDSNYYAQLVATNMFLADQQQRLQQQLLDVQQAAQQMQNLNLGNLQHFATPPVTPQNVNMFQQQVKQSAHPIITPVAGAQPGLYSCFNPMTGQHSYFIDNNAQNHFSTDPVMQTAIYSAPQQPGTPRFQVSPPPNDDAFRSISPPKKVSSPPTEVTPLPPPSAGAFRRGHRKAESMAFDKVVADSPRLLATPKTAGLPSVCTPGSAGFGPGQARAGDHPIRQPRGPPPLDELRSKPTAKFEGSKNFAARTRRSAVHNLVRAGLERRRAEGSRSGSMSQVSESGEVFLAMSSEDDASDSGRSGSGSLSGRPSLGSSRTSAHGAIGSDRPSRTNSSERRSALSIDSTVSDLSVGVEEIQTRAGSFAAVFKKAGKKPEETSEKKAPMLVLTSADKRKSSVF